MVKSIENLVDVVAGEKPKQDKVKTSLSLSQENYERFKEYCGKSSASDVVDRMIEIFITRWDAKKKSKKK